MNSYERVMMTLGDKAADRVPVFLFFTYYGAAEMGCSIREYITDPAKIVEGQKRLLKKFGHDCLYPFTSAALEAHMFGQEIEYYDDGAPNAGEPIIKSRDDIFTLNVPDPEDNKAAMGAIEAVRVLAREYKKNTPVISAVIGPFSLPIMLMGMKRWLDMFIDSDLEAISEMTSKTSAFCVRWANMLFAAGADCLGFFEPFGSTTIIRRDEFVDHVFLSDKDTISRLKGPVVFCGAGGRFEPIIDRLVDIGAAGCLISTDDDLAAIRRTLGHRINILGNLNNIAMIDWDYNEAKEQATGCLQAAGKPGGYILSDQHGEISFGVKEDVLHGIVAAARDYRPAE